MSRSDKPHSSCTATKGDLRADGLEVIEDCPICAKRGILREVGCHASQQAGGDFESGSDFDTRLKQSRVWKANNKKLIELEKRVKVLERSGAEAQFGSWCAAICQAVSAFLAGFSVPYGAIVTGSIGFCGSIISATSSYSSSWCRCWRIWRKSDYKRVEDGDEVEGEDD